MITKHCVLVAEDNPDEVYLLRRAFRRAGLPHEIIEVRDGVATIEYLKGVPPFNDRTRYPLPRLLLLDLKMPKVNGFEVLAWLETQVEFNSLPAVVLSSSVFQADSKKALDLGAREFLTKPYDLNALVTVVEGLHERWLAGEETMPAAAVAAVTEAQAWPAMRSQVQG